MSKSVNSRSRSARQTRELTANKRARRNQKDQLMRAIFNTTQYGA